MATRRKTQRVPNTISNTAPNRRVFPTRSGASAAQQLQRQLAWLLYVLKGSAANVEHAMDLATMLEHDKYSQLNYTLAMIEQQACDVHEWMKQIDKKHGGFNAF